jgi:Spy/CpxP family protein refolding chaperone
LVLVFGGLQAFAQSAADKAASQAKDQANSAASQAKDQATDAASQAKDQATNAASQAKDDANQALGDPETKAKVQAKLQKLSNELNLTDDQKAQLKPVLQGEVQQLRSVHNDASLSDEQKGAKMKEIHAGAKSQINTILTPEQQQKLAAMKEAQEDK